MDGLWIGLGCAVVITVAPPGARWAGWRLSGWRHLRRVHPQHAGAVAVEQVPEQDFYGSMSHDEERTWKNRQVRTPGGMLLEYDWSGNYEIVETAPGDRMPAFLPAEPDWRDQTMADLSPEALATDPGPGVVLSPWPPPGPVQDLGNGQVVLRNRTPQGPLLRESVGGAGSTPALAVAEHERLADTGDIQDAALLAEVTTYMRDQDADVADWCAAHAQKWARLEIGVLT